MSAVHADTPLTKNLILLRTEEGWPRLGTRLTPNGAAVLPVTSTGRFILVRERRYFPDRKWRETWNLLRGGRDHGEEPARDAAQRETYEEAGIQVPAHRLVDLGCWFPELGMSTASLQLFAAVLSGLEIPTELAGTDGETVDVAAFTESEIRELALKGEMRDLLVPAAIGIWKGTAAAQGWTSHGTKHLTLRTSMSDVSSADLRRLIAWRDTHPAQCVFEIKGEQLFFFGYWVPLDDDRGPWD